MSVNSSLHPPVEDCSKSRTSIFIFSGLFFTYVLFLLPLLIFVLFVGFQRWRKQCSVSTAATASHSDFFTYNMVALELIGMFGCFVYICGAYTDLSIVTLVGFYIFTNTSPGQTLFHILTCVERYLAVVHPITYLGLRQASAARIRNIRTGCVWLLCIASLGLKKCSGPGEVSGNRKRVDQSKQRAFHTIMAIMGALLFVTSVGASVMYTSSFRYNCVVAHCLYWLSLPSSLVLPLLFLNRAGKLPGCQHNTESV